MTKITKIIYDSPEKTEELLNSYLSKGYEMEIVAQNAVNKVEGSTTWTNIYVITTIYLTKRNEI